MRLSLKNLFSRQPSPAATPSPALAVAQLLLEIARADQTLAASELAVVRRHLAQAYALDDAQLDTLIAEAQAKVDRAVSLYDTVKVINQRLSADDKRQLIHALWQVAYADQTVDAYEEALLRRLADLLYVPHSVFIREKLATRPERA